MKIGNVLSLFDGKSCGRVALERAGIEFDNYYSSEIDKNAIRVSKDNYNDIIQLGNVVRLRRYLERPYLYERMLSCSFVKEESKELVMNCIDILLDGVDLLMGGSPCQGFSSAGKGLNFDDPRSRLFFEFVRIREIVGPKYFILENVKPKKKEWADIISEYMGVGYIKINSKLVSAQNRVRYYWTNIEGVKQPEDKNILLSDIIEHGLIDRDKSLCITASYGKGTDLKGYFEKSRRQVVFYPASIVGRRINEKGVRDDYNKGVPITQCLQVKHNNEKSGCLTTVTKDNVISILPPGRYMDVYNKFEEGIHYRLLTPVECERLQTLPDGYTSSVSKSQRYKLLGNGWTVDVVAHIFSYIK